MTSHRYIVLTPSLIRRFEARVSVRGPDECWPWTGPPNEHGYGQIRSGGEIGPLLKAHRVAWQVAYPDEILEPDVNVLHRCDNPPCCNPAHLFIGTQADNVADAVSKGRQARGHGAAISAALPRGDHHWTRRMPERMNLSGLRGQR